MNEPIISPWMVYIITRLDALNIIFIILGALLFIFDLLYFLTGEYNYNKKGLKILKTATIIGCIFATLAFLLPTSKELMAMYAASKITPANIEIAGETVDKATDKIVGKIIRIIDATKEEKR